MEEMELEDVRQLCQLQAAELEIKDNQLRQVRDILESTIQGIDDRLEKSNDFFERVRLSNRRMGLLGFRAELIQIFGEEEEDGSKKNLCSV